MNPDTIKRIHYTAKGLLTALMLFSAGMYLFNPQPITFTNLGYPSYLMYPLACAKILGLIAIWTQKSSILKDWAYAGFFYDVLLAFVAHLYVQDGEWPPALLGILFVVIAVTTEKHMESSTK